MRKWRLIMDIIDRLANLTSRLDFCKQVKKDQYVARCPAHADSSPSLSIGLGRNGDRIVINCYAGCTPEEVVSSVGLSIADLFPDDPYEHVSNGRRRKTTPDIDELIIKIAIADKGKGRAVNPSDRKSFAAAVKRESARLGCNALEHYMGGAKT
jgi:putative DNA primase/helicase